MSQTRWQKLFGSAVYGPVVDPLVSAVRTIEDAGEVGAADLVGHEVLHYLAHDEVLRSIFADRMEFMPWRNLVDFRKFPRLGVYLASMVDSERPTSVSVEQLSVYVTTWWEAVNAEPAKDGEATIATVFAHIKRVLRTDKARTLVVQYNDVEVSLSNESVVIEGERFAPVNLGGERVGFLNELQVGYKLHLDRSGVRLINLSDE